MSKQSQSPPSNRPVHTIRHRSLKASIWCNETEKGPMYNVTVVRSYVENGEWHDSTSYGYDDLMNVAKLMFDAHTFITDIRRKETSHPQPEEAPVPERQQVVTNRRGQERSGK